MKISNIAIIVVVLSVIVGGSYYFVKNSFLEDKTTSKQTRILEKVTNDSVEEDNSVETQEIQALESLLLEMKQLFAVGVLETKEEEIQWRSVVGNEVSMAEVSSSGFDVSGVEYDRYSEAQQYLLEVGFDGDFSNMTDGHGGGSSGYKMGDVVCKLYWVSQDDVFDQENGFKTDRQENEPLLVDIQVSCGIL